MNLLSLAKTNIIICCTLVASLREKGLEKDLIIEQQAKNMKLMRSQFKHDALRFSVLFSVLSLLGEDTTFRSSHSIEVPKISIQYISLVLKW
jgi:hypothetical protein